MRKVRAKKGGKSLERKKNKKTKQKKVVLGKSDSALPHKKRKPRRAGSFYREYIYSGTRNPAEVGSELVQWGPKRKKATCLDGDKKNTRGGWKKITTANWNSKARKGGVK